MSSYRISTQELQEYGAKWHEQGARSADMSASMAQLDPTDRNTSAAATLSLASAIESLVGNVFVATSAICERLEKIEGDLNGINLTLLGRG